MPLQDLRIENAVLSADTGMMAGDIQGLELSNVRLSVKEGAPLSLRDARNVTVEKFEATGGAEPRVRVAGARTHGIRLQGVAAEAESVAIGPEVTAGAVRLE